MTITAWRRDLYRWPELPNPFTPRPPPRGLWSIECTQVFRHLIHVGLLEHAAVTTGHVKYLELAFHPSAPVEEGVAVLRFTRASSVPSPSLARMRTAFPSSSRLGTYSLRAKLKTVSTDMPCKNRGTGRPRSSTPRSSRNRIAFENLLALEVDS